MPLRILHSLSELTLGLDLGLAGLIGQVEELVSERLCLAPLLLDAAAHTLLVQDMALLG